MRKPALIPAALISSLLFAAGCGGRVYVVTSLSLPREIVIDGDAGDWAGALSYVASDKLFVGFVNDRNDLFICLTKEEGRGPAPGRMGGWTVWFDPAGGTTRTFGLRVAPLGGPPGKVPAEGGPGRTRGKPERKPVDEPAAQEQGGDVSPAENDMELQWIGANGAVLRRLAPDDAAKMGLEVREGRQGGASVLEIKIPLAASGQHPFAVGAGPGGLLGVGFFSNRAGRPQGRGMGGGGTPGGMGGGAVGGPGGWRGAVEPNMNPDLAEAVKVWTQVRLRQEP